MMATEWERAIQHALPLLQEFEQGPNGGFAAVPYRCPAGKLTIGFGHVIAGEEIGDYQEPLWLADAEELLWQDAGKCAGSIAARVTVPLTLGMQAALISLVFNIGRQAFANSTLLRKLNAGDYPGAAREFLRWNKATDPRTGKKQALKGLTRRREAEQALFRSDGLPE